MQLSFNGLTALQMTRAIRSSRPTEDVFQRRVSLCVPHPGEGRRRFSRTLLSQVHLGNVWSLDTGRPIEVAVPTRESRVQLSGVVNTVYSQRLPQESFIPLEDGLSISSPELLFVEMAAVMPFFNLVLLGCELCGSFSRDAHDPHDGPIRFDALPVTSKSRIEGFLSQCNRLPGIARAREALPFVLENAWSPMEALVAVFMNLPPSRLGYGLTPVTMNKRLNVSEVSEKKDRVPDMLVAGDKAGLNYDGEDHFALDSVIHAAITLSGVPGSVAANRQLDDSVRSARQKYVDDRRRDRELAASGHQVLVVTKEDLAEQGGLDRVALLVMDILERESALDLSFERKALGVKALARLRQDLIWSAMSGKRASAARKRIAERRSRAVSKVIDMEMDLKTGEIRYL